MMRLRDGTLPGFKKERERVYSECKGITFLLTTKENGKKKQKITQILSFFSVFAYFCGIKV